MYVVIFKATVRTLDAAYSDMAARLRQTALNEFGCLAFEGVSEGDREIALSYWASLDDIQRWKQHAEHLTAQRLGCEAWYSAYSVEIARIERSYRSV